MLWSIAAGLYVIDTTSAQLVTTVSISPSSQDVCGETFTVNIYIEPVTPIAGVQFDVSYNSECLSATGVTEGPLLDSSGCPTFFIPGTIDNGSGTITGVAGTVLGAGCSTSTPGTFAIITFTATSEFCIASLDLLNVKVTDVNADPLPLGVFPGTVDVCMPTICYDPQTFNFAAQENDCDPDNPPNQILDIWNCGDGTVNWDVSDNEAWLTLSSTSGSSTGETDTVTLSVDKSGMSAGSYTATITISAPGATNTPQTIPVSLTINECGETICYSPSSFSFSAIEGGTSPAAKSLSIWNCGDGTMNWGVSDNAGWLTLNPISGSSASETDTVSLLVDTSGMSTGSYAATITLTAAGATNSPQTVPITLTIYPASTITDTWTFDAAGCVPKHLPDSYTGQVVLANLGLDTIPDEVQGVYWYDCVGNTWRFWAPGAPGTTLATLGGGHTYDYLVCVTGGCEWEIPLVPSAPIPSPTPPPTGLHNWNFCAPACFPKHLPDSYTGQVVLADPELDTIPSEVQGVYWWSIDEWLFWAPGAPGTTLATLGGGHTYDYLVCSVGPCEWEIPLP